MIANWPGRTPAGEVSADLLDSTDLLPAFAEIVGGNLPENTIIDGQSFAPQGCEVKKANSDSGSTTNSQPCGDALRRQWSL